MGQLAPCGDRAIAGMWWCRSCRTHYSCQRPKGWAPPGGETADDDGANPRSGRERDETPNGA